MLAIARSDSGFNVLPTAGLGLRYLMSDEGAHLRRMLLLALTENDRLHTEEVQRLWDIVKEDITVDRVLGAAWEALTDYSLNRAEQLVPGLVAYGRCFRCSSPEPVPDLACPYRPALRGFQLAIAPTPEGAQL